MTQDIDLEIDRAEDFSTRIDDLLASALEDQAREKQLMTGTVAEAQAALTAAREELKSIRELIDRRDRAVVDAIEARLSGVGTELTLNSLADRLEELSRRKPADEAVEALTPQLQSINERIGDLEKALAVADPWKPAAEVQRALEEKLGELASSSKEQLSGLSEAIYRSGSALQKDLNTGVVNRLDSLAESVSTELTATREEMLQGLTTATAEQSASLEAFRTEQSSLLEGSRAEAKEVLQKATARLSEKLVLHQNEMTQVLTGLLEPYEHELQEFIEGIRRTNLRIRKTNDQIEELRQALVAHVAHREQTLEQFREQVVADIVTQISEGLEKPDRKRMVDALHQSKARKQDKRDAERYRKLIKRGKVMVEQEPPPPAEPPLVEPLQTAEPPPVVEPQPPPPKPVAKRSPKPVSTARVKTSSPRKPPNTPK